MKFIPVILAANIAIAFGIVVYDAENEGNHFGIVGDVALNIAQAPWTLKDLLFSKNPMEALRNLDFGGQSGWKIHDAAAGEGLDGYLLLSSYQGDEKRHVIDLVSLPDLQVKHQWRPDASKLLEGVPHNSTLASYEHWKKNTYRAIHPLLLDNGDLLIKDHQSVLMRISPCGEMIWRRADQLVHHSSELDATGAVWVPSYAEPASISKLSDNFHDDTLSLVSLDGEELYRKSLVEAFVENGLFHLMFTAGAYSDDPLHLNDIQPVLEDGPFWKRGDVFLSLRHRSMLVLYRPSTNKILWSKAGPWLAQHDVDILDDHRIAVFSNNAYDMGKGGYVKGHAQLLIYDFTTYEVTAAYDTAMATEKVATQSEGLADYTESGHVIVEQENDGRLLIFGPDERLFASYVNAASDGRIFRMGWSRYVPQTEGRTALSRMEMGDCNG